MDRRSNSGSLFRKIAIDCWLPDKPMVILGRSNEVGRECYVDVCETDGVPILKRYGGGGAVVLYSGCVIVSLGTWVKEQFDNQRYFSLLNDSLIHCLASQWPALSELCFNGISDIAIGDRKVGGTSLFRSRNYLLYQASLICRLDLGLIDKYLRHPSREPDYRSNRSHQDFLTDLESIVPEATSDLVKGVFADGLQSFVERQIKNDLIEPVQNQFKNLEAKRNSDD